MNGFFDAELALKFRCGAGAPRSQGVAPDGVALQGAAPNGVNRLPLRLAQRIVDPPDLGQLREPVRFALAVLRHDRLRRTAHKRLV